MKAAGLDSVLFRAYATAGALDQFFIVQGNEQKQPTLSVLEDSLVVGMLDEYGNPLVNEPVAFKLFDEPQFARNSNLTPDTAYSNETGHAATSLRLGDVGGKYFISADPYHQSFTPLEFEATAVEKKTDPSVIDTVNTVVFDGNMDTFMFADPDVVLNAMQSFTTEIWILPNTLTEYYELFNKEGSDEANAKFKIWGENDTIYAIIYLEDGSTVTLNSNNIFEKVPAEGGASKMASSQADSVYRWTHLALSVDNENKTIDLYRNGFRVAQSNFEGDVNPGNSRLEMGRGYDGEIHEVRIWNDAISRAGIQSRMTQILEGNENNLVLYHTFDDEGDVATDLTGNGNDLQLGDGVERQFSIRGIPDIEMLENERYIMVFKDIDEFGDTLSTVITRLPENGTLYQVTSDGTQKGAAINSIPTVLSDPKNRAMYLPYTNYSGADSLDYKLQDEFGNEAGATRLIKIHPVYKPPTVFAQLYPSMNDSVAIKVRGDDRTITFNWEKSEAYGDANTEYLLSVWDAQGQIVEYTGITDTTYSVEVENSIFEFDHRYTWRVKATDGIDTTQSVDELSFMLVRANPLTFMLQQNYPNPFNPSTTIEYWIPITSRVKLEIFDVLGRRVLLLVDKANHGAGTYQKRWDSGGLSSGVYYYRLSAEGINGSRYMKLKKMTLIK
ncbi:MAG: T9SS type A sorting domain-containing protein [Balneolaceae bacterium]|nr:T9SS type A sorting domain-containing protein [Balneolaceae bacterium]